MKWISPFELTLGAILFCMRVGWTTLSYISSVYSNALCVQTTRARNNGKREKWTATVTKKKSKYNDPHKTDWYKHTMCKIITFENCSHWRVHTFKCLRAFRVFTLCIKFFFLLLFFLSLSLSLSRRRVSISILKHSNALYVFRWCFFSLSFH